MTDNGKPNISYRSIINDSGDPGYVNRLLVGTPTTGSVRIEWVQARFGQIVPVNWSWVQMYEYLNGYMPLRYQVDDAQNLIVDFAIQKDFQWLLLWEHDNVPNADALLRLNTYMTEEKHPVVSGLYFTRAYPSDPLIFRGRGTGAFYQWDYGERVYCDAVPTGFLLIHVGVLKEMWNDSPEYTVKGQTIRQVFRTPRDLWSDPEKSMVNTISGTSDLDWCDRLMKGDYLRKAGWGDYLAALPDPRYPLMVDTNLFTWHINPDGTRFPDFDVTGYRGKPVSEAAPTLGVNVTDHIDFGESLH